MYRVLRACLLPLLFFTCNIGLAEISLVTEGFPPFNYEEADGRVTGFSTELVRLLCIQTKDCGSITLLPWSRAYVMALERPGHALFSVYRRPERETSFKWVGPLTKARVVFFARSDSSLIINSLDDARRVHKIGVQKDSIHHLYLMKQGFKNLEVVASSDRNTGNANLRMLLAGRFDLWMATEMSGYDKVRRMGISSDRIKPMLTLFTEDLYIAFNVATPDAEIQRWQAALDQQRKTPAYRRLAQQFLR